MTPTEEVPQPTKYFLPEEYIPQHKKPNYKVIHLTLREYAAGSTIHGISYIFDRGTHAIDRIFWVFVVLSALYGACLLYTSDAADE